jgi:hypothetical protein
MDHGPVTARSARRQDASGGWRRVGQAQSRTTIERSDAVEYLDSEGHDPLSDDVDPSEALPEEDDELIDLEGFEAPEDLDPDDQIVEDEPS